jgi:predicted TIM-barrel fold metal-dependent hydrolase
MKEFTTAEFMASVRETYEEMQALHKEVNNEKVSYPDFEAAMDFVERHGLPEALSLEKQYAERLGRMAQLCATICPWVLDHANMAEEAPEVKAAADEIMDYVEAVRP